MNQIGREILRDVAKVLILAGVSVGLGVCFGVMAGMGAGWGFMADVCAVFGAIIGLLTAPPFVWGLWHAPRIPGLLVVASVTGVVALVGGLGTPSGGAPFAAMFVSVVVYVSSSFGIGVRSRCLLRQKGATLCASCGYSLHGLRGNLCPECGGGVSLAQQIAPHECDSVQVGGGTSSAACNDAPAHR